MTPRPEDPCRDPASETRDDHAVDETYFNAPIPRACPPCPPEMLPLPSGYVYYGQGPLISAALKPTPMIKAWNGRHWSKDTCTLLGVTTHHLALHRSSNVFKRNMFTNLETDKI